MVPQIAGHVSVDTLLPCWKVVLLLLLHMENCRKATARVKEAQKIQALAEKMFFFYGFNSKFFTKREGRNWTAMVKE